MSRRIPQRPQALSQSPGTDTAGSGKLLITCLKGADSREKGPVGLLLGEGRLRTVFPCPELGGPDGPEGNTETGIDRPGFGSDGRDLVDPAGHGRAGQAVRLGDIYIGKVKHVVKNIGACFVELQKGAVCFLPLDEAEYAFLLNRKADGRLLEGDELPLQVSREAKGTKQPVVTVKLTLSGEYFVFAAGAPRTAFSARLSASQREALRRQMDLWEALPAPGEGQPSWGVILRTKAGEDPENPALKEEYIRLSEQFFSLFTRAGHRTCFSCLYRAAEGEGTSGTGQWPSRQILFDGEYDEIVTDLPWVYERLLALQEGQERGKPVRLYQDPFLTLEQLYGLSGKLKEALSRKVWLDCGGYLVIDQTEALTVFDVNTGKCDMRHSPRETVCRVNREAAREIARQLRLRSLSGILLADFINMETKEDQDALLDYLREQVSADPVPVCVVDMTALGLVEMTRKKVHRPLGEWLSQS